MVGVMVAAVMMTSLRKSRGGKEHDYREEQNLLHVSHSNACSSAVTPEAMAVVAASAP